MGLRRHQEWHPLLGLDVTVKRDSTVIRRGRVDAVTSDDQILWLEGHGAERRRLFERSEGFETWIDSNDDALEEVGGMNVFFVMKDGSLVTPALSGTILEGATRKSVIQVAKDMGREVIERKITLDEWRDGLASGEITEVFACATPAVITPLGVIEDATEFIGSLDARTGETTKAIRQLLSGAQTGTPEDTRGWQTRRV